MDPPIYLSTTYYGVWGHIFTVNLSFKTGPLTWRIVSFSACHPKSIPFFFLLPLLVRPFILLVFTSLSLPGLLLFIDPWIFIEHMLLHKSDTLPPPRPRLLSLLMMWASEAEDTEGPYRRAACPPPAGLCVGTSHRPSSKCCHLLPSDLTPRVPLTRSHPKGLFPVHLVPQIP